MVTRTSRPPVTNVNNGLDLQTNNVVKETWEPKNRVMSLPFVQMMKHLRHSCLPGAGAGRGERSRYGRDDESTKKRAGCWMDVAIGWPWSGAPVDPRYYLSDSMCESVPRHCGAGFGRSPGKQNQAVIRRLAARAMRATAEATAELLQPVQKGATGL